MTKKTFWILTAAILLLAAILLILPWTLKSRHSKLAPELSEKLKTAPFSAQTKVQISGTSLSADITRKAADHFTLCITKPDTLAGTVINYDGQKADVTYHGIKVDLKGNSLLSSAAAPLLKNALLSASTKENSQVSVKNGIVTIKGKSGSQPYQLTLRQKDGTPLRLSLPTANFNCDFSNFSYQK